MISEVGLVHLEGVTASCLPEAVPISSRRNLTNAQGESYPLGVLEDSNVALMEIFSQIIQILIAEVLGYNVEVEVQAIGQGAAIMLYKVAGCERPEEFTGCNGGTTRSHVMLAAVSSYVERHNFGRMAPQVVGNGIGYEAISSLYVDQAVAEAALRDSGLPLAFYQSWNASWFDPSVYFDNYTEIPTSSLARCNETWLGDASFMADYVTVSGDHEGLHPDGTAVCPDGFWFLAPSCRANPSRCVPSIASVTPRGRDIQQMLQKSAAFDMPLAISRPIDASARLALPHNFRVAFWNLAPTPDFLPMRMVAVQFPPQDNVAWAQGDLRTMFAGSLSEKLVSRDLSVLAPPVVELLTNFEVSNAVTDQLLFDLVDSNQSLCQWLLSNRAIWSSWIPDETQCSPGFGLHYISGGEYAASREDLDLIGCKACSSGRYSEQLFDQRGYTHTCDVCPAGRSQPSGAAVSCEPCGTGEYQDVAGSQTCKRCGIGTYQDETGSTGCKNCTSGTTTVGLGSISELDCGCPAGQINIATEGTAVCIVCQAGMQCPPLSSGTSLFSGASDLGKDYIPMLLPGFMSLEEEGLDVYKCDNSAACPGGRPGNCAGASKGISCFECADGQQWNGEECRPCQGWVRLGWIVAIVGVCACLPFAHRAKMEYTSQTREILVFTFLTILEIGGNVLQTLAITGQMTLEWPQLLVSMFSLLQVFAFEAADLGLSCVSGSRPLQQFGFQVAVLPCGLLWLLLVHFLFRMLSRGRKLTDLMASMGQMVVVCFQAVSNLSMVPFMCFRHPNGRHSNLQMLSILCGSDDHAAMMIMGTCLGALLCAFWAICVWILWRLPSWSMT
ncbi:unnamed protein product, partial [Symbiodinium sp. KB8]